MLFSSDFDLANCRAGPFEHPFARKIALRRRIIWIERSDGVREAPSTNHSWYVWNWRHRGPPVIEYWPPREVV
jgi:hypothetical protein